MIGAQAQQQATQKGGTVDAENQFLGALKNAAEEAWQWLLG